MLKLILKKLLPPVKEPSSYAGLAATVFGTEQVLTSSMLLVTSGNNIVVGGNQYLGFALIACGLLAMYLKEGK